MRKLEGVVKELSDELGYLKQREERFSQTNGALFAPVVECSLMPRMLRIQSQPSRACKTLHGSSSSPSLAWVSGKFFTYGLSSSKSI